MSSDKKMTDKRRTLAVRLTRWYAVAFMVFLGSAFLSLYLVIAIILDRRMTDDLVEDVGEFAGYFREQGLARVKDEIASELHAEDPQLVVFQLLQRDGQILYSSDVGHWQGLTVHADWIRQVYQRGEPYLWTVDLPGQEFRSNVALGALDERTLVLIGESTEEQAELLVVLISIFTVMLVLAVPVVLLVGWFIAQRAARGIAAVSRTAAQITGGRFDQRVEFEAEDIEVHILVDSFNAMLTRIRDLVVEMREMTDNIAHDMRSPLARIRAISESALQITGASDPQRNAAADIIQECDRLLQMINTTLDLAEAGAVGNDIEQVDLSLLITDACELFEPVADDKQLQLTSQLATSCQVSGNVPKLQRMLANILDNAIKYTPSGGKVAVTLRVGQAAHIITVADTGIGIREEDQLRIFDRFFRCDKSRSIEGFGMGLSFSRAVAHAHGGDIAVTSEPGAGSIFTITLPTATAS